MNKAPLLIFAISVAGTTAASAASGTIAVTGTVAEFCTISQPQASATAAVNSTVVSGQSIVIPQLTNPNTLATNAASFEVQFNAACNYATRLTVESANNGLWRTVATPAPPGFGSAVPYQAQVQWGGTSTLLQADAAAQQLKDVSVNIGQATQGTIDLTFAIQPGASNVELNSPLLAGAYADIIRVTVGPQ